MKERKRNRLQGYDYSKDNLYFITSCIHDRVCYFGEIVQQQMILNKYGQIAEKQWFWLGEQYPYVNLHAFVVMPNHIHGIIEIDRIRYIHSHYSHSDVGTGRDLSLHRNGNNGNNRNNGNVYGPIKIKSLSELMGAYKTTVSKQIHLAGLKEFKWQCSFYDRIIRDEKSFEIISRYILNNPVQWKEDKFYEQ